MKKVLFALLVVAVAASCAYAAEKEMEQVAQGVVKDVSIKDPVTGAGNSVVTVLDDTGKMLTFKVDPVTAVTDASLNTVTLGQLRLEQAVEVKYTESVEGEKKAAKIVTK